MFLNYSSSFLTLDKDLFSFIHYSHYLYLNSSACILDLDMFLEAYQKPIVLSFALLLNAL